MQGTSGGLPPCAELMREGGGHRVALRRAGGEHSTGRRQGTDGHKEAEERRGREVRSAGTTGGDWARSVAEGKRVGMSEGLYGAVDKPEPGREHGGNRSIGQRRARKSSQSRRYCRIRCSPRPERPASPSSQTPSNRGESEKCPDSLAR